MREIAIRQGEVLMKKWYFSGILAALLLAVNLPSSPGGQVMQLTSSAFADGGKIPLPYVMVAAGGRNLSLPLSWSGTPAGTRSFALSIVDPHPVAHNWVHWLVKDIPGSAVSLEEGASGRKMPPGAVELQNSWASQAMAAPNPLPGTGDHPYVITLYALSEPKLEVRSAASLGEFKQALEGKNPGHRHPHRLLRQMRGQAPGVNNGKGGSRPSEWKRTVKWGQGSGAAAASQDGALASLGSAFTARWHYFRKRLFLLPRGAQIDLDPEGLQPLGPL